MKSFEVSIEVAGECGGGERYKAALQSPSYSLPQPVTQAVWPTRSSSESGTQTGMMLGWKVTGS